jgi:hypothetical protein
VSLVDLLRERGVTRALIVDDACDPIPRARDLQAQQAEWGSFNDDLTLEQRQKINGLYRESARPWTEKISDDAYVAVVWGLRHELGTLAEPLFESYIANQSRDLEYVSKAKVALEALGLACEERGRDFADATRTADVVVIDLFLGSAQNEDAFAESKRLLREALAPRRASPPLVLLMSRSNRLEQNRDAFRDDVGLLESGFRVIAKKDLDHSGRLERQLERLAQHAKETAKLARFFDALERGVAGAASRALLLARRLRLSDIAQIQHLLLDFEGEPTGSYLVDVFDRVLQHEIERDREVIAAATALENFPTVNHPPPYVAGSADLQSLVERMLTQNAERLHLRGSVHSSVTFGDVLRLPAAYAAERQEAVDAWAKREDHSQADRPTANPLDIAPKDLLLVLTPVCDLLRDAAQRAPRILVLVGTPSPMGRRDWLYGIDNRTVAITIDGVMSYIKWDLKHVDTISWAQLDAALKAKRLEIFARLREAHAHELQQRVLAGLGRVGLAAPMPATFPVDLQAFTLGADNVPVPLVVEEFQDGAVCWVGRDQRGSSVHRLVLTEGACDRLVAALIDVEDSAVAEAARTPLRLARSSAELRRKLESGLDLKGVADRGWSAISVDQKGQATPIALIAWNYDPTVELLREMRPKAGVLILIRDAQAHGGPGLVDLQRNDLAARGAD